MRLLDLTLPAVVAALIAWLLTPVARWLAHQVGAVDQPGPRKVHKAPIARLGGLAVIVAVAIVFVMGTLDAGVRYIEALPSGLLRAMAVGLLPVLAVSVWDDIRPLRALPKLGAHVLGAALAVWMGVTVPGTVHLFDAALDIRLLAVPISILWIVGVTNAFNIIDGLDGLSAGLALISAVALTAVFLQSGQRALAGAALVLVGAICGFLPYNIYPARIFLGDTGATALGFGLACLSVSGSAKLSQGFAILIPVFILGVPIADTAVSFFRRLVKRFGEADARGGSVFEADRNHIHHRLLALGIHHKQAVLILYAVGLLAGALAFLSVVVTAREAGFLLAALVLAAFVGLARLGYDEFAVIRKGIVLRFYDAPVLKRSLFVVFVDLLFVAVSVWLAYGLKHDDWALRTSRAVAIELVAVLAPVTVGVFWVLGLYRGSWRLASVDDLIRSASAVLASTVLGGVVAFIILQEAIPISLIVLFGLLHGSISCGSRVSYRLLNTIRLRSAATGDPVVIYGAGQGGVTALKELLSDQALCWKPVGFIDDDPEKSGKLIQGYPVFGDVSRIPELSGMYKGVTILVSSRKIPREKVREAARLCHESEARLQKMEISFSVLHSPVPVDLEVSDLDAVDAGPDEFSRSTATVSSRPHRLN